MPKQVGYSKEFVLAIRARWAKRDTYKSMCKELNCTKMQFEYILKAPMKRVLGKKKSSDKSPETFLQTNGFHVDQTRDSCTPPHS